MSPADRIARAATLVLPALSVTVAALVFLGPGALRPTFGARLRGWPADAARVLALRVELVKSDHDIVDDAGSHEIVIEGSARGQSLTSWRGWTSPDGIAEARLEADAPIHEPIVVRVAALAPRPRLLASGAIAAKPHPPPALVQAGTIAGVTHGDVVFHVEAVRGILSAPFAERMRARVALAGDAPLGAPATLTLSGVALDVSSPTLKTDARGAASFAITPHAHNVELSIEARAGDRHGIWEGTLPVVAGAIWLSPEADHSALRLVSPAPKDHAYVSFWTEEGRAAGAVVPLDRDPLGFYVGRVTAPDLSSASVVYATVAGDPMEQGAGTVAWPIRPEEGAVAAPPLALVLDGLPDALDREKRRASATRRAGLVLLGAAALAEVLLLLVQSLGSHRRLAAHLEEASGASGGEAALPEADRAKLLHAAREHPVLHVALAAALVALAFAMVAALATFR